MITAIGTLSISSQLWLPHLTVAIASGLRGWSWHASFRFARQGHYSSLRRDLFNFRLACDTLGTATAVDQRHRMRLFVNSLGPGLRVRRTVAPSWRVRNE